jgi:branched-subunit amino acid transport protein
MALSYKARRRWSLVILLLGLPAYIVAAVTIMSTLERPPVWVEFLIYVALGVIWALPFRFVFRGIGKPDPERTDDQ